ncbi:retropepsin-like aspartic protease, partial [Bacillus sp. SRB_8]|uniref:retropepsin-like aspartic protease n=1 Tax=Bacillus sp. SRB_8 TaxID=1969377 RepID=UPI00115C994C
MDNSCETLFSSLISVSWHQSQSTQLHCLIDSGASSAFIDATFAERNSIPLVRLPRPLSVEVIDGRRLSSITHRTLPLRLEPSPINSPPSLSLTE